MVDVFSVSGAESWEAHGACWQVSEESVSHLCHPALSCSAVPRQVGTWSSGSMPGSPVVVSSAAQSFF